MKRGSWERPEYQPRIHPRQHLRRDYWRLMAQKKYDVIYVALITYCLKMQQPLVILGKQPREQYSVPMLEGCNIV